MNKFQVPCTYDEVLRFNKSAAHEVSKKCDLSGISVDDSRETFTQIVIDNFDTEISSQNGKMTTHSLAVLVAQTKRESESLTSSTNPVTIKRLKKKDMQLDIDYQTYQFLTCVVSLDERNLLLNHLIQSTVLLFSNVF